MIAVLRSDLAEEDLQDIWRYIAVDNRDAADRLLLKINSKLELYSRNPGMGTIRDTLAVGLRSFPVGNYLVLYRIVPNGIELVRVLHGARNLKNLLDPNANE